MEMNDWIYRSMSFTNISDLLLVEIPTRNLQIPSIIFKKSYIYIYVPIRRKLVKVYLSCQMTLKITHFDSFAHINIITHLHSWASIYLQKQKRWKLEYFFCPDETFNSQRCNMCLVVIQWRLHMNQMISERVLCLFHN